MVLLPLQEIVMAGSRVAGSNYFKGKKITF